MNSRKGKKKKPSLHGLSRVIPSSTERSTIFEELIDSPPIVVAILGAAMVELELDELIRENLPHVNDTLWSKLTSHDGPFHTFKTKTLTAESLCPIEPQVIVNLNIIRNIRNTFAHSRILLDFDHDLIKSELQKIQLPTDRTNDFLQYTSKIDNDIRFKYISLCMSLLNVLMKYRLEKSEERVRITAHVRADLERQIDQKKQETDGYKRKIEDLRSNPIAGVMWGELSSADKFEIGQHVFEISGHQMDDLSSMTFDEFIDLTLQTVPSTADDSGSKSQQIN